MTDVPDLPNFSRFHDVFRDDAGKRHARGRHARGLLRRLRRGAAASTCRCSEPEIDRRLKEGPELVSANFVIPYPPGFPIMVPGQVMTQETIDFMRKLDVKEIHGYDGRRRAEAAASRRLGQDGAEQEPPQRASLAAAHSSSE